MPEEDVEPKQIILDPDDQPMWESVKTVAPTPSYAIIQLDADDNFVVNTTHLNMIRENKFDGYLRADPHDHIREFLAICDMFKYGETESEKFLSTRMRKSNRRLVTTQEHALKMSRAWSYQRNYYSNIYHGLDEPTQGILDVTAGGIFLYKSQNQAFQLLEDKVLFKHDWSTKKTRHHQESISFADGSDSNTDNS
nr:hypothetical protein [Tanacetum cinerariifolium]